MSETANISRIAELASQSIFETFGWKLQGPRNTNWPCITKHASGGPKNAKSPTHPTDAVYTYADPYEALSIFVNADFKSYGKSTLETVDLSSSLRSLANTIECANKSPDFQERFDSGEGETVGLLFVYNHDNEYEPKRFRGAMAKVSSDALDVAKDRRMTVMGPEEISYLSTIANDIRQLDSAKDLRSYKKDFFYPDLVGKPARSQDALSLESLVGPWQVARLVGAREHTPDIRYYVYYRGTGASMAEFEYLLDSFFRFQMLEEHTTISVRLPNPAKNAATRFDQAKESYVERFHRSSDLTDRLNRATFHQVVGVINHFSEEEIGMRRG